MLIQFWTIGLLALFNVQYSYDVAKVPVDAQHVGIVNGSLRTCIYPKDRSFKKGSKTFPRSELRSLEEFNGKGLYSFYVNYTSLPEGTDYSVWQVFGGGKPLLMIRSRKDEKQMVVFDGDPKIQIVSELPKHCEVDCHNDVVRCGEYVSEGSLRCTELHMKVGVYAQQTKPKKETCIEYGVIESKQID